MQKIEYITLVHEIHSHLTDMYTNVINWGSYTAEELTDAIEALQREIEKIAPDLRKGSLYWCVCEYDDEPHQPELIYSCIVHNCPCEHHKNGKS